MLHEINGNNEQVSSLLGQISTASDEQSQGITQVNTAMSQMDKVTQGNAANAEESAAAAEELSSQAQQMQSIVDELVMLINGSTAAASSAAPRATMARTITKKLTSAKKSVTSIGSKASAATATDEHLSKADELDSF